MSDRPHESKSDRAVYVAQARFELERSRVKSLIEQVKRQQKEDSNGTR